MVTNNSKVENNNSREGTHKCRYMKCNLGECKNKHEDCYEIEDWIDEGRFTCFSSDETE